MMSAELEQIARNYREACGVDCVVLDKSGHRDGCGFCQAVKTSGHWLPNGCSDVHRYGTYQAERFGGQYIYFCANSLLHWSIPLIIGGETQAVLVGGPVLLVDAEEMMGELSSLAAFESELKALPYMEPPRATALADLLFRLVRDLKQREQPRLEPESPFRPDQWYPGQDLEPSPYPFDKEKELLEVLASGTRENAQALVNDILGQVFFASGRKIATVRVRAHELLVLLSRAAVEGGASAEEVFGINQNWMQRLQQAETIDEVESLLARVVRRFADCVFVLKEVKHADIMHKAVRFIRQNYQEKLSLESVAAQVYLSPTYFSRLFKNEMKASFVAYLTELRVEKSKRLLTNRSIPLVVVAGMVGFDDQSYFTRVFKRVTGMSPGKFRESRGA